jgi:hypothetical protein
MPRLRIDLADAEFAALLDLAGRERRTAGDQAAVLLERALTDCRPDDAGREPRPTHEVREVVR